MSQVTTQAVDAKSVKYLTASNLTALTSKVNDHLTNGWMMHGAIQVASGEFIQTMVKVKSISP